MWDVSLTLFGYESVLHAKKCRKSLVVGPIRQFASDGVYDSQSCLSPLRVHILAFVVCCLFQARAAPMFVALVTFWSWIVFPCLILLMFFLLLPYIWPSKFAKYEKQQKQRIKKAMERRQRDKAHIHIAKMGRLTYTHS